MDDATRAAFGRAIDALGLIVARCHTLPDEMKKKALDAVIEIQELIGNANGSGHVQQGGTSGGRLQAEGSDSIQRSPPQPAAARNASA